VGTSTFDPSGKSTKITLSNGNKTAAANATGSVSNLVRVTGSHSTGRYRLQFTPLVIVDNTNFAIGICDGTQSVDDYLGSPGNHSVGFYANGDIYRNAFRTTGPFTYAVSDIIDVEIDFTIGAVYLRKNNGFWNADSSASPETGLGGLDCSFIVGAARYFALGLETNTESGVCNFGASAYIFPASPGFVNW
jgi:hypothetical protein